MLQRLSEADLLRMEFADFCYAQGDKDYDYTSYNACAVMQFKSESGHLLGRMGELFHHAHKRPWNFRALAERLTHSKGKSA
jgi:hypothetical protein